MNDKETTVEEAKLLAKKFVTDRDWKQFHDAKKMADSLMVEMGELMELFLWKTNQEVVEKLASDQAYKQEVEDETADVFFNLLMFVEEAGIDLSAAFEQKIAKAEAKYPIEKAKGINKKYTQYVQEGE